MKKKLSIYTVNILIIILLALPVYTTGSDTEIKAGKIFPSLLTVYYKNGVNIIKFEPLKDNSIKYNIYRSESPILKENDLKNSNLIASIGPDEIPYQDKPDKDGNYYYAVLAKKGGSEYRNLIPLQNTTVFSVDYSPFPKPVKIKKAFTKDKMLFIIITPVVKGWKYYLYVSNNPITANSIKTTSPVKVIQGKRDRFDLNIFDLNIKQPAEKYIAVIPENRLGVKNYEIIENQNYIKLSMESKPKKVQQVQKETKPEIKPVKQKETINKKLAEPSSKKVVKTPKSPGIKSMIDNTVKRYYLRGMYSRTIKELLYIINRYNPQARERAKAYYFIAQSLYYKNDKRKAIKYFIICKDYPYFREECEAWIERILEEIE